MNLIDFDSDLDLAGTARRVVSTKTKTTVVETVRVTPVHSPAPSSHLLRTEDDWSWDDLRNYVIGAIERCHGPQVRDNLKEAGIFKGFINRYGAADAARIAKFAFGFCEGMWHNAPISVNRFCKASDPFFGDVILARLRES